MPLSRRRDHPILELNGADLREADLSNAILSKADLSGAKGWTVEQFSKVLSLEGTTMPDGQILKIYLDFDGPSFEDWAKSTGSGEDGKNE